MSNILKDLAPRYNLTVSRSQAWGTVDGYQFVIAQPPFGSNVMRISTAVSLPDEAGAAVLTKSLTSMTRQNLEISCERKGGRIEIGMRKPSGDAGAVMIDAVLMRLVALFRLAGAVPACFKCGAAAPGSFAMVNGDAMMLCTQCEAGMEGTTAKGLGEFVSAKSNLTKGMMGALVGALAGAVIWVAIGLFGYLAAIGGVAISFCALKGYQLRKGKITGLAILIICLVSIAAMVFAQFFTWDILAYHELAKAGHQVGFLTIVSHTFSIPFESSETSREFIKDMLLGLLFLFLGGYLGIKPLIARASAPVGKLGRL